MTDLLTRDEYAAIASELDLPRMPYIDGRFGPGNGPEMPTLNPATGEILTSIQTASPEDVDLAVDRARTAFEQGHWSRTHPSERKDMLIRLCKLITRRRR